MLSKKNSEFENIGEVDQISKSYTHLVDLISYSGLDFAEHFASQMSISFLWGLVKRLYFQ